MEIRDCYPGCQVERTRYGNKVKRGTIEAVFSVSDSIHVRYEDGRLARFVRPANFEPQED
jgi:hypothetical protein